MPSARSLSPGTLALVEQVLVHFSASARAAVWHTRRESESHDFGRSGNLGAYDEQPWVREAVILRGSTKTGHSDRSGDCDLPIQAKETPTMPDANFADVNGQHLYYSVQGAGKPLIVLHGGIDPDSFGSNLAKLAKGRQVIAVHLQAHGRTPDSDRPLRSETLGDDVAALIGHLNLGKADVMGYSLGSSVALQTAIRHPDVVDRLVLVAARMRHDGAYPEVVAAFNQLEANAAMFGGSVKASPLGQAYPGVDWTNLFSKVGDLTKLHPARTYGRVLEGVGRGPVRCRDRWLTAARKSVRNRAEHDPLHARHRADAAADRRALPRNRIAFVGRGEAREGLTARAGRGRVHSSREWVSSFAGLTARSGLTPSQTIAG
jgi:pimeloyl-ACP methyl ester carboxylesterase